MAVEDDIEEFRNFILANPSEAAFQQFVAPAHCRAPLDFDPTELRGRIARRWLVPVENVVIVGSAKIGFTLVDKNKNSDNFRPAFSPFYAGSDIDVAIVSDAMFDNIWNLCFQMWHRYRYSPNLPFWQDGRASRDYHFRGWIRPDFLPVGDEVGYRRQWFNFYQRLMSERAAGDYRITAGIFRNHEFLMQYQSVSIDQAREQLRISAA